MEQQTPLEELEIRIDNLIQCQQAIEQELAMLLQEKEKLITRIPIGFKLWQHNDEKKTWDKRTSHNKPKS